MIARKCQLLCLVASLAVSTFAQGQRVKESKDRKPARRLTIESSSENRPQLVAQVRSFAERAIQFDDIPAKVQTLCSLATLLWNDDSTYARKLITESFEAVEKCPPEQCDTRQKSYLRNVVISRAAKLDDSFALELITSAAQSSSSENPSARALNLIFAAAALLESSPSRSIALAEQSLRFGVVKELRTYLFKLRASNRPAADNLFLKAVAALNSQTLTDFHLLMHLGAYLYKSPTIPETESAVEMIVISGELAINLSVERANVSEFVVKNYLNAAVDILSRPMANADQAKLAYAIATQLSPKVQQMLPDRAAQFTSILHARTPKTEGPHPEAASSSAEKPASSDSALLEKMKAFLDAEEISSAVEVANKIADTNARKQSLNVIKFYDGLKTIYSDPEAGPELVIKLDHSKERALLHLAIAKKRLDKRENSLAHEAFTEAVKDMMTLPPAEQGVFLLTAAYEQAALDMTAAKETFASSLKRFENKDLDTLLLSAWTRTITVDDVPHRFSLLLNRVERQPANLIKPFLTSDPEWTIATILGLGKDKVAGPLFIAIAQTILQENPRDRNSVQK